MKIDDSAIAILASKKNVRIEDISQTSFPYDIARK